MFTNTQHTFTKGSELLVLITLVIQYTENESKTSQLETFCLSKYILVPINGCHHVCVVI